MLFADAVSRLARRGQAPPRVTFLGKPVDSFDALAFIKHATQKPSAVSPRSTASGSRTWNCSTA